MRVGPSNLVLCALATASALRLPPATVLGRRASLGLASLGLATTLVPEAALADTPLGAVKALEAATPAGERNKPTTLLPLLTSQSKGPALTEIDFTVKGLEADDYVEFMWIKKYTPNAPPGYQAGILAVTRLDPPCTGSEARGLDAPRCMDLGADLPRLTTLLQKGTKAVPLLYSRKTGLIEGKPFEVP